MTRTSRTRRPAPRPTPRSGSFAPIPTVPVPRPPGGTQEALIGPSASTPARPDRRADRTTTDLDLIVSVLRLAIAPGYLLVGRAEHVMRCDDTHRDHAVRPARYEADTVAQLLDSGYLTLGGTRPITVGEHSGPGHAVIVPARTRHQLARWQHLSKPGGTS